MSDTRLRVRHTASFGETGRAKRGRSEPARLKAERASVPIQPRHGEPPKAANASRSRDQGAPGSRPKGASRSRRTSAAGAPRANPGHRIPNSARDPGKTASSDGPGEILPDTQRVPEQNPKFCPKTRCVSDTTDTCPPPIPILPGSRAEINFKHGIRVKSCPSVGEGRPVADTQRVPEQNLRFCPKLAACLTKTSHPGVGTSSLPTYLRIKSVPNRPPEFGTGSG